MTPTSLGHYLLEAPIGSGSMGTVYRARDTRLNRAVAIKLLRPADGTTIASSRRMLKEARAASALNHPNIVIVHEFGETAEGESFIVQELIEGDTLRQRVDSGMPLALVMDICGQVARALAAAHAAGIVHRDIKPENVMIRADGYVKVLDFGIAHSPELLATSTLSTTLETIADGLSGTPAYMSPEVMLGGEIGPPTDVFALGVMLFEMVLGKQPFTAPTAVGVLTRIASEDAPLMTSLDPTVPPGLDALVQAMLDKTPARRPTAADVADAFPKFVRPVDPKSLPHIETSALTVGREKQLAQLDALYDRARLRRSTIVGVTGEPGIGKTTLLEAFMGRLRDAEENPTVVRVRCSESLAGNEAYLPVLEALDGLRSHGRSSLDVLMSAVAPAWHGQVSENAGPAVPASPERMKRELRAFLFEASRRAPLVWIIEDLHWADVSTIDMLNYLATRFDDMRLLIVLAFRPSDMTLAKHPFLSVRHDLLAKGVYEELALGFLTRADVAEYLSLRCPDNKFPAGFVDEIHSRTEGSPLFMTDLVRYLQDTGTIVEIDGVWSVEGTRESITSDLPESVRGMIARKIERLNDSDHKLLLAASVQGHEFDAGAVAEVLAIDAADVEEQLEALQLMHGLVEHAEEVEYPDGSLSPRYRFVHVLYQNMLYASLQPARRVSWCGKTATALATRHQGDPSAAGHLAVLFEAARDFASAGQYFYAAGTRAATLLAFRECLTLADRGLAGVSKLPDGPARKQLELALQMTRGLALRLVRGWAAPELEPTLARARQLCLELEDPPELLPVMWNLTFFYSIRGHLGPSHQEQLDTLTAQAAAAADEPAFLGSANHLAGVAAEFRGDILDSHRLLESARELHDPKRHAEYSAMFGMDPGMIARVMSARPLWALGYPEQALERAKETVALSRSQRQPVTQAFVLIVAQGIHLFCGEEAEAIKLGDEIIALCEEYEFAQEAQWGRGFQGGAFSQLGQLDRGADQLTASLDQLAALRSGLARTLFLSLQAEALWRANRIEAGLEVIDEAFAYAESSYERGLLHEIHRIRGALLFTVGRTTEAEASVREALVHARRQSARSFELRAAMGLARILTGTERQAEARDQLGSLLEWFTEGHNTADHVAARALLQQLNGDTT